MMSLNPDGFVSQFEIFCHGCAFGVNALQRLSEVASFARKLLPQKIQFKKPRSSTPGSIQQAKSTYSNTARVEYTASSQVKSPSSSSTAPTAFVQPPAMTIAITESPVGPQDALVIFTRAGCLDFTDSIVTSESNDFPLLGGGFSDVFRGQLVNGSQVAIRRLRLPSSYNQNLLKKPANELYAWSKLHHPNILEFQGVARFRGNVALVSPWIEMGNVLEYLRRNPSADRYLLCYQVSSGLEYLHRHQLIHGELKAANILVSNEGVAKLNNVGISGFRNDLLRNAGTSNPSAAVRWTAPEVLRGTETGSYAADVWSWAMTSVEIMTSQEPFAGKSEQVVILDVMVRKAIPTRPAGPILPQSDQGDRLWDLLKQCWSYDPSSRPSANQVHTATQAIRQN